MNKIIRVIYIFHSTPLHTWTQNSFGLCGFMPVVTQNKYIEMGNNVLIFVSIPSDLTKENVPSVKTLRASTINRQ